MSKKAEGERKRPRVEPLEPRVEDLKPEQPDAVTGGSSPARVRMTDILDGTSNTVFFATDAH